MYKFLFLFLAFFAYSCANPNSDTICNDSLCKELNRNVCEASGDSYNCLCNPGYKDKYGVCSEDTTNSPCSPNPCTTEHRTVCNSDNEIPICLCDNDYHDENGSCLINTKTAICQHNLELPKDSHEVVENVEVKYENNAWQETPYCEIVCDDGFNKNENGECISTNVDLCLGITCQSNASCDAGNCLCDSGFHKENDLCVANTKTVSCNDITPTNATKVDVQVEITYTEGVGWSIPDNCSWGCNTGYHISNDGTSCEENVLVCNDDEHEENGVCLSNSKMVACNDNTPENATKVSSQVEVTYNQNTGWSIPIDCTWNCNNTFHKEGLSCISNTKMVDCNDATPTNATKVASQVEITYIDGSGWSIPTDCSWTCNNTYHNENNVCVSNTKLVNCVDATPTNATKVDAQVEITYTEGVGWSTPDNCTWGCNTGYHPNTDNTACELDALECGTTEHEENGVCVSNTKMVACNDVTPSNATTVNSQVEITYIDGSGWSFPSDCDWNCNSGYHEENNLCVEDGTIACDDQFEANNTSETAAIIVDANARDSQYTNLTICEGDEDWFKIESEPNSGLEIDVNYTHVALECDIDVKLYKMVNGSLSQVDSSVYSTGRETLYVRNTLQAETYYIKVYGYKSNCASPYSLTANIFNNCIDDEENYSVAEQDDVFEEAKSFSLNTSYNRMMCDFDDDWYQYYFNAGDSIHITLDLINENGDLDIFLYDADKNQLAGTYSFNDQEVIDYDITEDGNYYIKVRGWSVEGQNNYTFMVTTGGNSLVNFDTGDQSYAIDDSACKVFEADFSDQVSSTTATISSFVINKLLISHDYLSDVDVYLAIGDENYSQIWANSSTPSGTLDNDRDDDAENDEDIDLINRSYDYFNGNTLGDKLLKLKVCDNASLDTGFLNRLDFTIEYMEP